MQTHDGGKVDGITGVVKSVVKAKKQPRNLRFQAVFLWWRRWESNPEKGVEHDTNCSVFKQILIFMPTLKVPLKLLDKYRIYMMMMVDLGCSY